jgi:hypothetical protein
VTLVETFPPPEQPLKHITTIVDEEPFQKLATSARRDVREQTDPEWFVIEMGSADANRELQTRVAAVAAKGQHAMSGHWLFRIPSGQNRQQRTAATAPSRRAAAAWGRTCPLTAEYLPETTTDQLLGAREPEIPAECVVGVENLPSSVEQQRVVSEGLQNGGYYGMRNYPPRTST